MIDLYKDPYLSVKYDQKFDLLRCDYNECSKEMSDEEYRQGLNVLIDILPQYHPKRMVVNTHKFYFVIKPKTQNWVGYQIIPRIAESGLKKMAFIICRDIFLQISIERVVEEKKDIPYKTKYFLDEYSAQTWLFKEENVLSKVRL